MLVLFASAITPSLVPADERLNEKYFAELRERRLFEVAEGFALHRLSEEKLSPRLHWDLSRELARTFDEHARYTSGDEQTDLWNRARQVLDDSKPRMTDEAPQFVLDAELAILRVRQADYLLEELDLFPHDDALRERVEHLVAESNDDLQKLYVRSERLLRRITGITSSPAAIDFTARELHARIYAVRYYRGLALWQAIELQRFFEEPAVPPPSPPATKEKEETDEALAKTLDAIIRESSPRRSGIKKSESNRGANPKSLDVTEQIRRITNFIEAIAGHDPPSEFTWPAQLLTIECRSVDAKTGEMERLIGTFAVRDLPPSVRADLETLRARYLVREKRFDRALEHIIDYRKQQPVLPGELFYWQQRSLAGLAALAQVKRQDTLAEELLRESDTQALRAVETIGGYWGDRCRLLAEQLHESLQYGLELARALQTARLDHRRGDVPAAVSAYGEALRMARQTSHIDLDMDLSLTLGGLLLQQNEFESAATVLRAASQAHPSHTEAARIDILHAYALGKLYDAEQTAERGKAYAAALTHHRQTYGSSDTAGDATLMLAQLYERLNQPADAIAFYTEIPRDHPRRLDADIGIARGYERLLDRLRDEPMPATAEELEKRRSEAAATLLTIVEEYPKNAAEWNPLQAEVALRTARLLLNDRPDYEQADRLLSRVLETYAHSRTQFDQMPAAEAETQQTLWAPILYAARQLRILSLAGQNQPRQAMALVEQLADENPQEVLMVVLGISSMTSESSPERRRQIGELQLHAAQLLQKRRDELSAIDRARLDQCLAEAYAATDQPLKSIEIYESLLERFPKDKRLQKTTADLLVECGTESCLERALSLWREIERRENEGTAAWTEARYHIAWCQSRLKQYDEALKLLKVTRLLYPDLPAEWKKRFAELERKTQQAVGGAKRR